MPEPQAHQALMEEIGRLEELAREWTRLFPQAAAQGQHWQKVLSQVQAHVARRHLPPGGGGGGEIRQEHHDQRPGGPGPVAPGRRHPHRHDHPGPARPGIPGGAPIQGLGRNQRRNPPGLGAAAQSPPGGPGRAPGPPGRLRTGNSWPRSWPRPRRPTSGPGAAWTRTTCC